MTTLTFGLVAAAGWMTVVWAASLVRRNATLVDRAWGLTFVVLAATYLATGEDVTGRSIVVAALVAIWGLRLCAYLTWRDRGRGEDWRQAQLRARAGRWFAATSLVTLFWFQALAAVGVATPLLASVRAGQPASLGLVDGVGVAVWLIGFGFEAIGDWQLGRFRSDPERHGQVLDRGLWRYTRHPNYFGDAVQWWGLGLIGLGAGAWWSPVGPAAMTIVLLRVTGVTAMEDHLRGTRGEDYVRYVRETSAFVPWATRRRSERDRPRASSIRP